MVTTKIKMLMITGLLTVFTGAPPAFAMMGASYTLVSGDFNSGGASDRTSSGYVMNLDSLGGIGGSESSSPQYALWGGGVAASTDSYAPTGSIVLDNGAPKTRHATVNARLEATDNNGVIGYYLSENATKPAVSDLLWSAVTSSLSLSTNATFTLSEGDGTKIVYAWFKDTSGNISTGSGASITWTARGPRSQPRMSRAWSSRCFPRGAVPPMPP